MSVAKDVIAQLAEAKAKLAAAQQMAFQGVVKLEKTENLVHQAVGGTNSGRRLLEEMADQKKALKAPITEIQILVKAIDETIGKINNSDSAGTVDGSSAPS